MTIPWGGRHPLKIYQQSPFSETFELYEPKVNGEPDLDAPINFPDGTVAVAQCRRRQRQDGELIFEFTVVIEDNALTISLTSAQTLAITVLEGYYDIFVTEPGQDPQMFMEGSVDIDQAVTEVP